MCYPKILILTIIFINFYYAELINKNSNIDIYNFIDEKNQNYDRGLIDKPKENLNVRECFSDNGYPTSQITCSCVTNFSKKVILVVGNNNWWIKLGEQFPCTDDENSSSVDITLFKVNNNETCYKPREQLEFFHSCTNEGYPISKTTCFCTFNFPQKVDLICSRGTDGKNWWYLINLPANCKGSTSENKTHVDLGNFYGPITANNCLKPEELLNIFHSCENKTYPAGKTSCTRTFNYSEKIHLRCYEDERKGLIWLRSGVETPCKYNLNPKTVHCYRENGQIICSCRRNCFKLNIKGNLSYSDIDNICQSNITKLTISNLNIEMRYNDSEKSIKVSCTEGLKLIGNQKLTCNYGILSGSIPHFYNKDNEVTHSSNNHNEYLTTLVLGLLIIILVIDDVVVIYIIVHIFKDLYKFKQSVKTNLNEETHSIEIRTSEL